MVDSQPPGKTVPTPSQYYFAYGANLNHAVREERRCLQPLMAAPGTLADYQLVFNHKGLRYLEPCFASLDPLPGSQVFGMVYRLHADDIERLDRTEGARYRVAQVDVTSTTHGVLPCFTYITREPVYGLCPSRRYLNLIIDGAKQNNLPAEYVAWLGQHASTYVPVISPLFSWYATRVIRDRLHHRLLNPFASRMGVQRDDSECDQK